MSICEDKIFITHIYIYVYVNSEVNIIWSNYSPWNLPWFHTWLKERAVFTMKIPSVCKLCLLNFHWKNLDTILFIAIGISHVRNLIELGLVDPTQAGTFQAGCQIEDCKVVMPGKGVKVSPHFWSLSSISFWVPDFNKMRFFAPPPPDITLSQTTALALPPKYKANRAGGLPVSGLR